MIQKSKVANPKFKIVMVPPNVLTRADKVIK